MFVRISCILMRASLMSFRWKRLFWVCGPNKCRLFPTRRTSILSCASPLQESELKNKLQYCNSSRELVSRLSEIFLQRGVPEASLSAEYLVAACFGLSRTQLVHTDPSLTQREWNVLINYALRRLRREPVQYIVGNWDFYNLTLKVRPPVLIPRPETEELVDKILQFWKQLFQQGGFTDRTIRCLEVGCGSGAISLSLLKAWKEFAKSNRLQVTAIDIDPEAVTLTRENAFHNLNVEQRQLLDIRLQDIATFSWNEEKYDFLVSNPPYVPEEEYRNLQPEIVQYESVSALLGGKDGMDMIRTILRGAKNWLKKGGILWLEVDPSHPKMIEELIEKEPAIGVELLQVFMDMSGLARHCKLLVTR